VLVTLAEHFSVGHQCTHAMIASLRRKCKILGRRIGEAGRHDRFPLVSFLSRCWKNARV